MEASDWWSCKSYDPLSYSRYDIFALRFEIYFCLRWPWHVRDIF